MKKSIFTRWKNNNLMHTMPNKGITLIALIITIIVMLILAIVSVKLASDSGLFSKAETGADSTSAQVARERAQDIVMKYYDAVKGEITERKNLSLELSQINGVEKVTTQGTIGPLIVKMKNGDEIRIKTNGTIEELNGETSDSLDSLWLTRDIDENTVEITGMDLSSYYSGNSYYCAYINLNIDTLTIPSILNGKQVVRVNWCDNWVHDDYAFFYISGVRKIIISEGITELTTQGNSSSYLFTSCNEVSFPSSIRSIGGYFFVEWNSLTNIILPMGLTSINDEPFYPYAGAAGHITKNITIPESVESISSFYGINNIYLDSKSTLTVPENKWGASNVIRGNYY